MLNIFIGLFLGVIAIFCGVDWAIITGIALLILNPQIRVKRIIPPVDHSKLFLDSDNKEIVQHSELVLGHYMDNPIHDFVIAKNPANGVSYRYDYFDTIPFSADGRLLRLPAPGEIYLNTGLIYKDTGIVVETNIQK
jgi:hypothetical protein